MGETTVSYTNVNGRDDRIAEVIKRLRAVAEQDLGFEQEGTRADYKVTLRPENGAVIQIWTNQVMGAGRMIVEIHRAKGASRVREILVWGNEATGVEFERCRRELLNIVRRASAVKP